MLKKHLTPDMSVVRCGLRVCVGVCVCGCVCVFVGVWCVHTERNGVVNDFFFVRPQRQQSETEGEIWWDLSLNSYLWECHGILVAGLCAIWCLCVCACVRACACVSPLRTKLQPKYYSPRFSAKNRPIYQ